MKVTDRGNNNDDEEMECCKSSDFPRIQSINRREQVIDLPREAASGNADLSHMMSAFLLSMTIAANSLRTIYAFPTGSKQGKQRARIPP